MKVNKFIEKLQEFVKANPEVGEIDLGVYMEHHDQIVPIGFYTREPSVDDWGEDPYVLVELAV